MTMIGSMADELIQNMLDLAKRLAAEAAGIARARLGRTTVQRKADNSVVTETDHEIQAHVLQSIAESYPDHSVCAEEQMDRAGAHAHSTNARYCWVIDPLDGTRNYASGFPCFAISIAVLDRGQPIVAVVREHNLDHLYAAAAGQGTTFNGQSVRASERPAEPDMLIGVPSSKDSLTLLVIQRWAATPGLILRNLGSTALHLGLVASGALTAAFGTQTKIWDVAAGVLLVREAGGRITDPFGAGLVPFNLDASPNDDVAFLAAAPNTHKRLLESIKLVTQPP